MHGARPALVFALAAMALSGCAGQMNEEKWANGHFKGPGFTGALFTASRDNSDYLCRQELPFDMIYPANSPLAKGRSAAQQLQEHYHKCMAILGHPDATLAPQADDAKPAPS